MGSWPFLIYMIDVLTTDGSYGGWGFLLFAFITAYIIMFCAQKVYEETDGKKQIYGFYPGQNLLLTKPWVTFKSGEVIVVKRLDNDGTLIVTLPDGRDTDWVRFETIRNVTEAPSPQSAIIPVKDVTKGPRKVAVFGMVVCFLGILYANFMPQKETAYKMLAAYVGQNVVESPRTQQLADSTIKYLDAQIKKYTEELDASAKAKTKEKEPK